MRDENYSRAMMGPAIQLVQAATDRLLLQLKELVFIRQRCHAGCDCFFQNPPLFFIEILACDIFDNVFEPTLRLSTDGCDVFGADDSIRLRPRCVPKLSLEKRLEMAFRRGSGHGLRVGESP